MKLNNRRKPKSASRAPADDSCSVDAHCPLVAMGASAGGLEVFGKFFDKMPPDTGLSFILVQHLDPTHETLMPELLSKHTQMPVLRIEDGLKIQPNHVYVIAPNCSLRMENCTLRLDPRSAGGIIDGFFRSLAQDQRHNIIGIILSGTGTDGTVGLKAIKEHGGLTIVQKPETAKFDGMPRNAADSGYADVVLAVEQMPSRIVEYIKHMEVVRQKKGGDIVQREVVEHLPQILPLLRKRTGHDFSRYKQSTLVRRIQRRMQVLYLESATEYAAHLEKNPEEVDALFKDLLIGVTQFFRDPDSFEALAKKVIPELLREKRNDGLLRDGLLRVWVPGCATGEEAYTLAILLAEHVEKLTDKPKIQIFGTDLDVESIEFARKGKYPLEIAEQVTPGRLKRFFKKTGEVYELTDSIRELCIFSPHNLIKDPSFSRLDLISCRNVLIYLEADLQKKLLPLFHYGLNSSGFLFLGPSENVATRSELFRTIDQKHRIFQRRPQMLHSAARVPLIDPGRVTRIQTVAATAISAAPREQNIARSIERVIVEEFAPPSVVINELGEVVYFAGDTGKFLKPPAGSPSNKLVGMARENLRLELRTLVHRAISMRQEAVRNNLRVKIGPETLAIDLVVRPLTEVGPDAGLYIVLFRELVPAENGGTVVVHDFASHEHPVIRQLESELRTTREDLQTTIEELETSNEELKSANEELLSMNEELQSANEELQTSKEEVQSANDELQRKIEETDRANAELRHAHKERALYAAIVQNSDDAIVGKTLEGIVTSWNKAAERIFGFSADEMIGQSILRIIPPELHDEEPKILRRLRGGERMEHYETQRVTKDGRTIQVSLTISPIKDPDGQITGASKIARDVTERKQVDEKLKRSEEQLRLIANTIPQMAWMAEPDGSIAWYNQRWYDYTGTTFEEMQGWGWQSVHDPKVLPQVMEQWNESIKSGKPFEMNFPIRGADGAFRWFLTRGNPLHDSQGRVIRWFGTNTNIDEARKTSQALAEERRILELLNDTGAAISSQLNLENLVQLVTDAGTKLSGAKFGAFFYNIINEKGESNLLYSLSGAPREAFEKFGLPRNTPIFHPTFRGEGPVRCEDVTKDPRYGTMAPHHGMPKGHLPVRSYLAVPVISRSGEVIGGLFFGHPEPGVFTERSERLIVGVAAQAAIAIDNARLFDTAQQEIAQRKETEGALNRANDELEQRVKERTASLQETTEQLETFCYTVAHDLRSPLRAQQSFAQVLMEDYKDTLDEAGMEYARRILQAAQRLDKLVHDLLTYSRLTRSELRFENIELAKVLRDVHETHAADIEKSGAVISQGPLHSVFAYEPTLNLIFTNLLTNAIKFVKTGETPRVRIWSELVDGRVRLWVEDQGIGIPEEGMAKIFGVFQRLHRVDQYPGTGIGLAIVQKGAERMGGRAGVESEVGQGSRFWIELLPARSNSERA